MMDHTTKTKDPQHPMIPVPEAIRIVLRETAKKLLCTKHTDPTIVPVDPDALHRISAHNVYMPEPGYPPFAASILDGYAIRQHEAEQNLRIVDRVHAGDDNRILHNDLEVALYVTTGAKLPDGGFDCVVGIENVEASANGTVKVRNMPKKSWIRAPGSDIPAGTLILKQDDVITPVELGLLMQVGMSSVPVRPITRVGVISSGNELLEAADDKRWLQYGTGHIPDVNGPMLMGLLGQSLRNSIRARHFGIVRDDSIPELTEALGTAAKECDVLITTGGISMGDADLMEEVLTQHLGGQLHFGRLHMKPGKPSTFITLPDGTLVFCLPGNPVSAFVCAHLLVQPSLDLLCYGSQFQNVHDIVEHAPVVTEQDFILKQDLPLDFERPEYHRIREHTFLSTGIQQSSRLMSCQHCAGLLVLPQATHQKQIAGKGEKYTMLMIQDSSRIRVRDSSHLTLGQDDGDLIRVKLLQCGQRDESLVDFIERGFGSEANNIQGQGGLKLTEYRCLEPNDLTTFTLSKDDLCTTHQDLTLIVGPSSLRSYSILATRLRKMCTKLADAMAFQLMKHGGNSPVRECVIGFIDDSCLIIYLSPLAIIQGLPSILDLLKHAIQTSKGK